MSRNHQLIVMYQCKQESNPVLENEPPQLRPFSKEFRVAVTTSVKAVNTRDDDFGKCLYLIVSSQVSVNTRYIVAGQRQGLNRLKGVPHHV